MKKNIHTGAYGAGISRSMAGKLTILRNILEHPEAAKRAYKKETIEKYKNDKDLMDMLARRMGTVPYEALPSEIKDWDHGPHSWLYVRCGKHGWKYVSIQAIREGIGVTPPDGFEGDTPGENDARALALIEGIIDNSDMSELMIKSTENKDAFANAGAQEVDLRDLFNDKKANAGTENKELPFTFTD